MSHIFPTLRGLKKRYYFTTVAFQLCFQLRHKEGPRKSRSLKLNWIYTDGVNLLRESNNTTKKQRTCNVTMTNVRETTVAVENQ